MKRFLLAVAVAAVTIPAFAADVGVSVSVGEPGFYGRIDIGNVPVPRPQLIYPQPVVIQPVPVGVVREPLYLHVPPGHAKKWHKHCHQYNACGQPVYFVQDNWYNQVYVPRYREYRDDRDRHHGKEHGKEHGEGHGKGHGRGHRDD